MQPASYKCSLVGLIFFDDQKLLEQMEGHNSIQNLTSSAATSMLFMSSHLPFIRYRMALL